MSEIVSPAQRGSIIHVDRSVCPPYPVWAKELIYPELAGTGPPEFDITRVELCLHDDQKAGELIRGQVICDHLEVNKMLGECFDLSDLLAIQARGTVFFRRHFSDKGVFAWKSVVQDLTGRLFVPFLYVRRGQVVLFWHWLDLEWHDYYYIARHIK